MIIFVTIDEATARFTFNASCGLSVFAATASIILGERASQMGAALFLLFAVTLCAVSIMAYTQYTHERDKRWRQELKAAEDQLNQVLNHARMNRIIEQITGPLSEEDVAGERGEQPIAKR